jgi:hypothetical protein
MKRQRNMTRTAGQAGERIFAPSSASISDTIGKKSALAIISLERRPALRRRV